MGYYRRSPDMAPHAERTAADIPRSTTKREQLVKVIDAAHALVNQTADPRIGQATRDHALRALHAAYGALNDHDAANRKDVKA